MRAAEKESRVNVRWRRGPNVSQSERPAAATRKGFLSPDSGMPPYAGILNPSQIDSIILFIRSLAKP
jgi:mono/diheme cytochrome c family protein